MTPFLEFNIAHAKSLSEQVCVYVHTHTCIHIHAEHLETPYGLPFLPLSKSCDHQVLFCLVFCSLA